MRTGDLRIGVIAVVVAVVMAVAGLPSPGVGAETRVGVVAPIYDSPGALVPVIVTAYDPPRGYRVSITGAASDDATVTCTGPTWRNPVRRTVSRTCYVQLPLTARYYRLSGIATFTKDGAQPIVVQGRGARALRANGQPSPVPMGISEAQEIERCHGTSRRVQLTFDDGASPEQLRSILRTLRRNGVRGRFFFTGNWAASYPSLLRLIVSEGHLVANHTKSHAALSKATDREVLRQIRGGVRPTTDPVLLRPPFGAGAFTTRLTALAGSRSHLVCRWTMDTYDWDGSSAATLVERVRHGDRRSPPVRAGGVILMHGHGTNTAAALQGIIDVVRAKGLALERLP
jgi:peptidoglycan-N-acetylglucosamine deacetylase